MIELAKFTAILKEDYQRMNANYITESKSISDLVPELAKRMNTNIRDFLVNQQSENFRIQKEILREQKEINQLDIDSSAIQKKVESVECTLGVQPILSPHSTQFKNRIDSAGSLGERSEI
jgi:hypothetical protein